MTDRAAIAALIALGLLTGCAQKSALEPVEGTSLPPAPYGAPDPLTSEELLAVDTQAVPERNIELRRESEEREDDPFDLPPEG